MLSLFCPCYMEWKVSLHVTVHLKKVSPVKYILHECRTCSDASSKNARFNMTHTKFNHSSVINNLSHMAPCVKSSHHITVHNSHMTNWGPILVIASQVTTLLLTTNWVTTLQYFYKTCPFPTHAGQYPWEKLIYHKTYPRKFSQHTATTHIKFTGNEKSSGANKLKTVTLDDNSGQV